MRAAANPRLAVPGTPSKMWSGMYAENAAKPAPKAHTYGVLLHDSPLFPICIGGFPCLRAASVRREDMHG